MILVVADILEMNRKTSVMKRILVFMYLLDSWSTLSVLNTFLKLCTIEAQFFANVL